MVNVQDKKLMMTWKQVKTVEDAKHIIDSGLILDWREAKRLSKSFPQDQAAEFIKHIAIRFAEKSETRLVDEMLCETMLGWLSNAEGEGQMQLFLETFLTQPSPIEASTKLVEVALTAELVDPEHDDEMFSTAVTLVCELGLAIRDLHKQYPEPFKNAPMLQAHIATYLLSVSNTNSSKIRLSLLNYFASTESGEELKPGLNKVMGRFGHTVLDQLFTLLFNKKSEAVAIQYLLENMHFILEGDRHTQTIVHETWKFYMLKYPDRFALFLKTFVDHYRTLAYKETLQSRRPLFQHLGALLRVSSEVNHTELIHTLIAAIAGFHSSKERDEVLRALAELPDLRHSIRDLVVDLLKAVDPEKVVQSAARFLDHKRGRKPSFSRVDGMVTMNQVQFLGEHAILLKAS